MSFFCIRWLCVVVVVCDMIIWVILVCVLIVVCNLVNSWCFIIMNSL